MRTRYFMLGLVAGVILSIVVLVGFLTALVDPLDPPTHQKP